MKNWFYSRIKFKVRFEVVQQLRLFFQWKIDPMIAYIIVNKPSVYWNAEEESQIKTISYHLETIGYCPIVRD
jgi:hypothetical protein